MPLSIDRPAKIICVGLNYRDHAEEQGSELPSAPLLFAKWGNTLIGDGDTIVLPPESEQVDYEAELGVVIGRTTRRATERDALDAVRGYICVNDVSARDLQFADGQWTRGKSPDTFCRSARAWSTASRSTTPRRWRSAASSTAARSRTPRPRT